MNITAETSGDTLTVKLDGLLKLPTALSLGAKLVLDGMRELGLDLAKSPMFPALRSAVCSKLTKP